MMRFSLFGLTGFLLATTAPAMAQDTAPPSAITVSGGATFSSDYRFRGLTQSDEDPAVSGTINVDHESGFYVGTWASTIDGDNSLPGYGGVEVDLYGGYSRILNNGIGLDGGLLYYWYADADIANSDFFEPYASLSYTVGPLSTSVGANYAWSGQSGLGDDDSLYLHADTSVGIPSTPFTVSAHIGRSKGVLGAFNPDPGDDDYWDTAFGVDWSGGPITAGVQFTDTDIRNTGGFAQDNGLGSTVLGHVGLSF